MNLKEFIKSRKRIMTEELVFHYFSQLVRIIKNYDMFYINVNILPEHIYFKEEFDTIHLKLPHFIRSHTTNELFTIQSIGRILDFMSSTIHKSNMLKQLIANMNQFLLPLYILLPHHSSNDLPKIYCERDIRRIDETTV